MRLERIVNMWLEIEVGDNTTHLLAASLFSVSPLFSGTTASEAMHVESAALLKTRRYAIVRDGILTAGK